MREEKIRLAAGWLKNSKHTAAFTGAGISVESGVPPFRGENGLWNKYDPMVLEIDRFRADPTGSWKIIRKIFYDYFRDARPNRAHEVLALMEQKGLLSAVITQNIDNLHQEAGSVKVYEYHGNARELICTRCGQVYDPVKIGLDRLPPQCPRDGGVLKPNFIFFGEPIPEEAARMASHEAATAEIFLVIGSTGEVMPACMIPRMAKQRGATIIEINPEETLFTHHITDLHLKGKAGEVLNRLAVELFNGTDDTSM
ncbi:MAG: SIR2 family NAD-dependent protein deacylase [Bacteroidales bacterium]